MSQLNAKTPAIFTHEGAPAKRVSPEMQLRRTVMACMLWEKQFYEEGASIADRIESLVALVPAEKVSEIAIEARTKMNLRHVPLLLARCMAKLPSHRPLVADTLAEIIQRPDELTEFLAIYWKDGRQPLATKVKKGLAKAFRKFSPYSLAKYNRDNAIKLRDVLFLCHAKPKDTEQAHAWKALIDGKLEAPDTWEVALSAGADKKQTWERLLKEGKLGGMALIRNLRNMHVVGVNEELIFSALKTMKVDRILPFRFIAAARFAPQWEAPLEEAMLKCLEGKEKIPGRTMLVIDVSGSMDDKISQKSDMTRLDAACGLAILIRELCEKFAIFTFSTKVEQVPGRRGFALRDAIVHSQPHGGTYLGDSVTFLNKFPYDRMIVITDEQSHDRVPNPSGKAYMINVASYKNGIGYDSWTHIDGWSEAVVDYIQASENLESIYEN